MHSAAVFQSSSACDPDFWQTATRFPTILIVLIGTSRRLGAAIVDMLILGVIGFGLGIGLSDSFSGLARWGFLVGFFLSGCYFAVLNSNIGSGQTFGKRLMKIQTVLSESGRANRRSRGL